MKIQYLKLTDGSEIITEVESHTDQQVVLKEPRRVIMTAELNLLSLIA